MRRVLDWLYEECLRRVQADRPLRRARARRPENKVTPELASLKGSGLHPLVVVIDEIQELFHHPQYGKDAGEIAEKVIKLGRALGVMLLIGTQIPDKDCLPTGITRNVNTRFCLSVADQTANDMILGTSAYKPATGPPCSSPAPKPGGASSPGSASPAPVASFYVDNDAAAKIVARAIAVPRRGRHHARPAPRSTETAAPAVRPPRPTSPPSGRPGRTRCGTRR